MLSVIYGGQVVAPGDVIAEGAAGATVHQRGLDSDIDPEVVDRIDGFTGEIGAASKFRGLGVGRESRDFIGELVERPELGRRARQGGADLGVADFLGIEYMVSHFVLTHAVEQAQVAAKQLLLIHDEVAGGLRDAVALRREKLPRGLEGVGAAALRALERRLLVKGAADAVLEITRTGDDAGRVLLQVQKILPHLERILRAGKIEAVDDLVVQIKRVANVAEIAELVADRAVGEGRLVVADRADFFEEIAGPIDVRGEHKRVSELGAVGEIDRV